MKPEILVANAPCSYGAFEDTVGIQEGLPEPSRILDHIAAAGYAGTDLGPLGWLGEGAALASELSTRGLGLAGGYLEMPFTQPELMDGAMKELTSLLSIFQAVVDASPQGSRPKPTLADHGSASRRANPGRAHEDRELGLDASGWGDLAAGVTRALEECRGAGFEPTFHHHTTSHIEAPWEIDRLLELTDIGLCLDTGHLLVGGGDPVQALDDWGSRINHIHVKDCRTDVIREIVAERAPSEEVWRRHAFCRLGEGDLDLDTFLKGVLALGFEGWLVVEQDGILDEAWPVEQAFEDQTHNRQFLRRLGF